MAGRKKRLVTPTREMITSYEGWNAGDTAWAMLPAAGVIQCEILEFHPKDNLGPAVTVRDVRKGCYRTVAFDTLRETPPKRQRKLS